MRVRFSRGAHGRAEAEPVEPGAWPLAAYLEAGDVDMVDLEDAIARAERGEPVDLTLNVTHVELAGGEARIDYRFGDEQTALTLAEFRDTVLAWLEFTRKRRE